MTFANSAGSVSMSEPRCDVSSGRLRVAVALQGGGSHGAFTWGSPLIDGRTKGALCSIAYCSSRISRSSASLDLNGFWPRLQDWFQIWFVPAKWVCSAATTWAPSPTAAADEDPVLRDLTSPECTRSPQIFHVSRRLAVSNARLALPN